jgi:hypothetical protein
MTAKAKSLAVKAATRFARMEMRARGGVLTKHEGRRFIGSPRLRRESSLQCSIKLDSRLPDGHVPITDLNERAPPWL